MIVVGEECKWAVEVFGRIYGGNQELGSFPSGCYVYDDRTGFFNKHESGSGSKRAKSIFKQGVYQFIHNQSLSNVHVICVSLLIIFMMVT